MSKSWLVMNSACMGVIHEAAAFVNCVMLVIFHVIFVLH